MSKLHMTVNLCFVTKTPFHFRIYTLLLHRVIVQHSDIVLDLACPETLNVHEHSARHMMFLQRLLHKNTENIYKVTQSKNFIKIQREGHR